MHLTINIKHYVKIKLHVVIEVTSMKFTYKRKVAEHRDYWEDCNITNLKMGDVFYIMEDDMEGPFLTVKSNPTLKPSANDSSKLIWYLETMPLSDENFS